MAPTTAMTNGKLYIFNYITDTANSDNQELNGKTEGTHWVEIEDVTTWRYGNSTMKKVLEHPRTTDGANIITALGNFGQLFTASGKITGTSFSNALTKMGYWQTFNYTERKDKSLYLIVPIASGVYAPFYNTKAESSEQYCQGTLVAEDFWVKWRSMKNLELEVGFTFKASW